jgi:Ca2+-transporting ATPase
MMQIKKFDLLNAVNEETLVKVIRAGKVREIPRKDVVVGDIIILETGEEIPADESWSRHYPCKLMSQT